MPLASSKNNSRVNELSAFVPVTRYWSSAPSTTPMATKPSTRYAVPSTVAAKPKPGPTLR